MAWGYRLESMGSRSVARHREALRSCAVGTCPAFPAYVSSYKYSRGQSQGNVRVVTVTRPLCGKHAMLFSMKYTVAWPGVFRRLRRPSVSSWAALAA
jgi:hypothetical protein